jgi:hypothetical protein
MPILAQLLSDGEARDFEMGAKRDPFEWYDVHIVPNVEAIKREINILFLLASERAWEMPGWEDVTTESVVEYFEYLVTARIASVWAEYFPGQGVFRQPSVGTRKALPMPATWLAYITAIGVVFNNAENYGLRPVLEGAELPADGRQIRVDEMGAHDRVVNYFYTLEAKRVLPIVRGIPRDLEGVSHVMHIQYVDEYFKTHQGDSTPNAAWVAGFLVNNRLERFYPYVKYFKKAAHLDSVARVATHEFRSMNRGPSTEGKPKQKPTPHANEGNPPKVVPTNSGNVAPSHPSIPDPSGPTATQE